MLIYNASRYIRFMIFAPLFCGCVSVNLGPHPTDKSDAVSLISPPAPFQEQSTQNLDRLWRNLDNGNTISYLSDCHNPSDPRLENIFKGVTSEIENVKVMSSSRVNYNHRDALHSTVDGTVDGVATRFELMIFKKNHCIYIITCAGTSEAFESTESDFANFIKGFNVK